MLGVDLSVNSLFLRSAGGAPVSLPFTLALLPAGSVIDHDPASLSGATIASWPAVTGSSTGVQATGTRQPALTAAGWGALPTVDFVGTSTTNPKHLVFDEALVATPWNFLVTKRGATQNASATNKVLIETGQAGASKAVITFYQRSASNAAQDTVYFLGLGGSSNVGKTGCTVGKGALIVSMCGTASHKGTVNGGTEAIPSTQNAVGVRAATIIGAGPGAAAPDYTTGASFSLARRVQVNVSQLPGGEYQQYTRMVIEGFLAWEYGIAGDANLDLVAALPAGHPFKARAPLASDWLPFAVTPQKWGNSLGNGVFQQSFAPWDATNRGLNIQNGCIGGTDSSQILARMQADLDAQNGTASGLPQARIREKVQFISDVRENDSNNGVSQATGRANIAAMMALYEAGQGVAAGAGRIIFWGRWRGNGEPGTDSRLAASDAEMATDLAEYPNYIVSDAASGRQGMGQILAYDARPGGPADDADAWARGVIPTAYRAGGGDLLHLNATGYARAAVIERSFALAKGWTI